MQKLLRTIIEVQVRSTMYHLPNTIYHYHRIFTFGLETISYIWRIMSYEALRKYLEEKYPLTEAESRFIESNTKKVTLKKWETFAYAGEPCHCLLFITKGCLRSFSIDESGKEHIVQFAPENWWISDQNSFFRQTNAMLTIDAVEDTEAMAFEYSGYQAIRNMSPNFASLFNTLLQNHLISYQKRIIHILSSGAEARYLDFIKTYPTLALRLPQKMIASYLGITPETLSRVRRSITFKPEQ